MPDIRGNSVDIGDTVVSSLREGNYSALRVGNVIAMNYKPEPQVEYVEGAPDVEVALVRWDYSSTNYLPKKPTSIATSKILRLDRV